MDGRKLAYSQGLSQVPLRAETVGQMWASVVAAHGDRDAIVSRHQGIRWTYAEIDEQVERCARALIAVGGLRGADQLRFAADLHFLHTLGPAGDNAAQREFGGSAAVH